MPGSSVTAIPSPPSLGQDAGALPVEAQLVLEHHPEAAVQALGQLVQIATVRATCGRLRVMLKHELRLDRERAGVLTQGRR